VEIDAFLVGMSIEQSWKGTHTHLTTVSNRQDGVYLKSEANQQTFINLESYNNTRAGLYAVGGRAVTLVNPTLETNEYGAYITRAVDVRSEGFHFVGGYIEGNLTNDIRITKEGTLPPKDINVSSTFYAMTGKATISVRADHVDGLNVDKSAFLTGDATYQYALYTNDDGAAGGVRERNQSLENPLRR
jgi:hypothetical protein